jgi:hypothetical protein
MEFLVVFALAAVVAMIYHFGQPRLFAWTPVQKYESSYFGQVALSTVVIFAAIIIAGFIFRSLDVEM